MNRKTSLSSLLALVCGVFYTCAASAVELIEDNRVVRTFFDDGSTITTPDSPFADFDVAYQNTTVTETRFFGSGNGYGESDFTYFIAESTFDITFEVVGMIDFSLTGFYSADDGSFGAASVSVDLTASSSTEGDIVIYSSQLFGNDSAEFSYDEPLAPGVYRLVLHTNITPGGFDTFADFSFSAEFGLADFDSDGVPDTTDNCIELANSDQIDSDGDSIGNQCDPDIVGLSCQVDFSDLAQFSLALFTTPGHPNWTPDADFVGDPLTGGPDGAVNFADLNRMKEFFFGQPGPSANGCN